MTESRSSKRRFFGFNFFDFILVIAIITMIIMAVVAKNFSPQTIQEVLISLGILSIAMLITSILYMMKKNQSHHMIVLHLIHTSINPGDMVKNHLLISV